MSRSENLPVLPQAVGKVLKMVDDPYCSAVDLEKIIQLDPAIMAKVLRVANSSFYGASGVPTIARAISFLGLAQIRSLVVGVAFQQMVSIKSASSSFDSTEHWRHCLAVASCARLIGRLKTSAMAEELYCAGMMHDVGMLVMARFMPTEFDVAIAQCGHSGSSFEDICTQQFGFGAPELGGLLAAKWNLGSLLMSAVRYSHNPRLDGDNFETTSIVCVANAIAHRAGFTNNLGYTEVAVDAEVREVVGIPDEQYDVLAAAIATEVNAAEMALPVAA